MSPKTLAADLRLHGSEGKPYLRQTEGWIFGFSRDLVESSHKYICIFSGSLFPKGRGSVEKDWQFLGKVSLALRLPPSAVSMLLEQSEQDPNGVLKAVWTEGDGEG